MSANDDTLGLPLRFWAKINKEGPIQRPDLGPCWIWTASKGSHGYGQIMMGSLKNNTRGPRLAHRLVLEGKLGRPIAPGMDTIHACDVRTCVNPAHLTEGPRIANVRDALSKGRVSSGERHSIATSATRSRGEKHGLNNRGNTHGMAVLTEELIPRIRGDARPTENIASDYNISKSHVCCIKRRKAWKHVA